MTQASHGSGAAAPVALIIAFECAGGALPKHSQSFEGLQLLDESRAQPRRVVVIGKWLTVECGQRVTGNNFTVGKYV